MISRAEGDHCMAVISYGLRTALRKPRLFIGMIIGIMLGISLLVSAFLVIDYFGYTSIKKEVSEVKVDIRSTIVYPSDALISNVDKIVSSIEEIEYVNTCIPISKISLLKANLSSSSGGEIYFDIFDEYPMIYGFPIDSNLNGLILINGSMNFTRNEIAVGKELAEILEVDVGDNISIRVLYNEFLTEYKSINFTVSAIVEITGTLWDAVMYDVPFELGLGHLPMKTWRNPNLALIGNISYVHNLLNSVFNTSMVGYKLSLSIFLDKDRIVNPWNVDETLNKLNEIEDRVNLIIQSYLGSESFFYTQNFLENKLLYHSFSLFAARTNITLQLIPSLFLGAILALIAIWLSVNERRREIGLLKIKGAKSSQITTMLFIEAILAGLIAGSLGGLLGYGTSIYIIKIQWIDLAKLYTPEEIIGHLIEGYIVIGIVMGSILGLLSVFVPARRAAKISVLEAIQEYSEELEAVEKIGKLVWFFMILGSYSILEIGLGLPVLRFFIMLLTRGGFFFLIFIALIFFPLEFISIYLGPFMFIYACSKLIGIYASRLSKFFSTLTKIFASELNYVAVRNFIRKKVRVARVIFLIALTLSFTVYYGIASATNENRMRIDTEISVGSDIQVYFLSTVSYEALINLTKSITQIDGVENVCRILETPLYTVVTKGGENYIVKTIGIDENYFNVSFMKSAYLEDINIKDAEKKLSSGEVITSINLKRYYGKTKNSSIILESEVNNNYYSFVIAGFIKFAPGVNLFTFELQTPYSPIVFISNKELIRLLNDTQGIYGRALLIRVKSGYNTTAIVENISYKLVNLGYNARVISLEKEFERRMSFGMQNLSIYFVKIEFYMALLIAFIGMILIMAMSVYERRREFALLVTRGASFAQLAGTLVSEAFLIVFLGFGLGLLVSAIYSYGFLVSVSQVFSIGTLPYEFPPGYSIVIPTYLIYSIIFGFLAFVFASIIPLIMLLRKPISEELRIHH